MNNYSGYYKYKLHIKNGLQTLS